MSIRKRVLLSSRSPPEEDNLSMLVEKNHSQLCEHYAASGAVDSTS